MEPSSPMLPFLNTSTEVHYVLHFQEGVSISAVIVFLLISMSGESTMVQSRNCLVFILHLGVCMAIS